jgi:hypothetical protein
LYHDIFGSYVFGRRGTKTADRSRFDRIFLQGVTLKAGVRDVFDTAPPLDAFRSPYFYSNFGSPRMREYWISLTKQF